MMSRQVSEKPKKGPELSSTASAVFPTSNPALTRRTQTRVCPRAQCLKLLSPAAKFTRMVQTSPDF